MPIAIFKKSRNYSDLHGCSIALCDHAGIFETVPFVFNLHVVIKVTMSRITHSEGQKEQTHGLEDAEKFFKDACEIFQRKQQNFVRREKRLTTCRRSWTMFTFLRL